MSPADARDSLQTTVPVDAARTAGTASAPRTVSLFVEARFAGDGAGGWAMMAPDASAAEWSRYAVPGVALRLVARAQRRAVPGLPPLGPAIQLAPLPYYVGLRALIGALPRLALAIAREVARADTVVLRLPGIMGLVGGAACRLMRRRYAVELVGDPADVLSSGALGLSGRLLAPLITRATRSVVGSASAALYVTETTLQRRYPHRPDAPVAAVSGVRLHAAAFVDRARRWQPGPVRIIAVGSQEVPYKGHDVLLRAVRRLRSDSVDATAVVVGEGRLHEQLVRLAAELGVAEAVTFTGAVRDRGRLNGLLDEASVFAMPSLTEGLPRALIEAMARALPAVGSDVGGIPELLDRRYLIPPGNSEALAEAIVRLGTDQQAWEAESRRNLDVAQHYRAELLDARFAEWLGAVPAARRRGRTWRLTRSPGR